MSLEIGSVVEGIVTGITNFGAFIELPEGKTGLVHISEVADSFVQDIRQFLKERDKVSVKVLAINEKGKYDLSIKQASKPGLPPAPKMPPRGKKMKPSESSGDNTFEDKLTRFLKESEERLLDLKRNTEAKRGRGKAR